MANRVDGEQGDLLDAVVKALIDNVPQLSSKNAFISIYPSPPYKVPDNVFVTVSPGASSFPEEFIVGGGQKQCAEDATVLVTIFSRFQCNQAGQERNALNEQTRGVLRMKRAILKALVAADLTVNAQPVLRNLVMPKQSGAPEYAGEEQLISVALSFGLTWDWDLGN
jgi:hypothetical protein